MVQVVDRIFRPRRPASLPQLPAEPRENTIVVAHELSPADMVLFKDAAVSAFVTDVGGATSHTAILARSLDIPSVLALHNAHQIIEEGELIIVDGIQGVVVIAPDEKSGRIQAPPAIVPAGKTPPESLKGAIPPPAMA